MASENNQNKYLTYSFVLIVLLFLFKDSIINRLLHAPFVDINHIEFPAVEPETRIVSTSQMKTGIKKPKGVRRHTESKPYSVPSEARKVEKNVKNRKVLTKININTADSTQLTSLFGIGPVLAARIIKFREMLGGFHEIYQLRQTYGLSDETFIAIRNRLNCSGALTTIDINKADFKTLIRHPYLKKEHVINILNARKSSSYIKDRKTFQEITGLDAKQSSAIMPYLDFTPSSLHTTPDDTMRVVVKD